MQRLLHGPLLRLGNAQYGRLSLELLVSLCSESPARIFGLENKGRIAKGMDADLVLFSEGEILRVQSQTLKSGAGWSPYTDRFDVIPCRGAGVQMNAGDWFVYYGPDAGWEILSDEEFKDTFTKVVPDELDSTG